jgi:hypothetical protein
MHTLCYNMHMKVYDWNKDKNLWLKKVRGITFDDILFCITSGKLLDVLMHTNPERYPNQKVFAVKVDSYVYLVPFVESGNTIFLKTIIPSRKMTKKYLRNKKK